jgi:hypothetical protein
LQLLELDQSCVLVNFFRWENFAYEQFKHEGYFANICFSKQLWLGKTQWRHEEGCFQLELLFVVSTLLRGKHAKDILKRDVYKLLELNWGWVFFLSH